METLTPATIRFQKMASMPTMQLFASTYCNLKCPYCSQGNARAPQYYDDLLNTPFTLGKLEKWPATHFYISGGEPLIHEGIFDFLRATEPHEHIISFDTNGVVSEAVLERIVDSLPPERFGVFNISHHVLAGVSRDVIKRTCGILQKAGIPHFVKYVGAPETLPVIARNMDIFRDEGTGVAATCMETFAQPWNGRRFPCEYSMEELLDLLNMVTLGTHAMQCFGGIFSKNLPCLAGSTYVAYNMKGKDELTTCCHRSDDILWSDTAFDGAKKEARPCSAPKCLGDLMFILGLQGFEHEMERFEQLCRGNSPALGIEAALTHVERMVKSGAKLVHQDRFSQLLEAFSHKKTPIPTASTQVAKDMTISCKSQAESIREKDKLSALINSIENQLQTRSCLLGDTSQRLPYVPYFYDLDRWPGPPAHLNMAKQHAARRFGFPLKFNVEVTTQCVYKCEFCVLHSGNLARKRDRQFMKYEDFTKLFSQIEPFVTHIEFTGGEPFLNKDLFRMIDLCNKSFVKTTLATNAKLLTEKNIAKLLDSPPSNLLIAYEAGEPEAYEKHRVGGHLEQLESNIKAFMKARDARGQGYPRTQLQTVVSRETAPYMDVFWERARLLNVDEACSKPVFIWPDGDEKYWELMISKYLIPDHPLSYYESDGNEGVKETGIPSVCPNLQNVHIGSDGKVIHCWYNLLASKPMGNVFDEHFVDIWFSEESDALREAMTNHTAYEHECRFCIGIYKEELFKREIYRQAGTC